MIQVTDNAIDRINEELADESIDIKNSYIRLYMGVGWGGPSLQLALEESSQPSDQMTEVGGIKFLIDSNQSHFFENVKLDFSENMFGFGGFKLVNV